MLLSMYSIFDLSTATCTHLIKEGLNRLIQITLYRDLRKDNIKQARAARPHTHKHTGADNVCCSLQPRQNKTSGQNKQSIPTEFGWTLLFFLCFLPGCPHPESTTWGRKVWPRLELLVTLSQRRDTQRRLTMVHSLLRLRLVPRALWTMIRGRKRWRNQQIHLSNNYQWTR